MAAQRFQIDTLNLGLQQLAQSRPSSGFGLEESRRLTGVENSGQQDVQKEIAEYARKQAELMEKNEKNTANTAVAVQNIADAAKSNTLLIANLGA